MTDDVSKAREFLALKRTKNSTWQYAEYSPDADRSFDEIAPDCGNYLKLRLIEHSAFESMRKERDAWAEEARKLEGALNDTLIQLEHYDTKNVFNEWGREVLESHRAWKKGRGM